MNKIIEQLEDCWSTDIKNCEYVGVPEDIVFIFNRAKYLLKKDPVSALELCEATVQRVWELLNVGSWSWVPLSHHQMYSDASYMKCLLLVQQTCVNKHKSDFALALKTCDLGLLLGAPDRQNAFHRLAELLNNEAQCEELPTATYCETEEESLPPADPLPSLECPSLETFYKQHLCPMTPTVLTACIEHWPARTKWNPKYLKQVAGGRTVPVELGSHYADEDWGQQLMTIGEFVDKHMLQPSSPSHIKGYLAQHLLFDQVPELKNDIYVPEYCCLQLPQCEKLDPSANVMENNDSETLPEINAWFGPAGTVSPLHYDSKHNIFAQVSGYKRVWLFKPEDSPFLYPHESPLLFNTAQVDPERPDLVAFPEYAQASAFRCVLRPGDCLYIPPRWWHHVRALTPSMSVSFWWN